MLDLAICEAWRYQLLTYPNPAVGCVIAKDGKILAKQAHKIAGDSHAELLALKETFLKYYPDSSLKNLTDPFQIENFLKLHHNNIFNDCEVYVTLEPCSHIGKTPSCANILSVVKPREVFVGIDDKNKIASGGIEILEKANIKVTLVNNQQSKDLIFPFVKWSSDRFVFFKFAIRGDGSSDGIVSSKDSFEFVHKIRDLIDLLVIGGNSVRVDRPTLDSRLVKGKAPNVLIYSSKKEFDRTIPLFNVLNRDVFIQDQFKFDNYNFIMVEGGYNLYKEVCSSVDMLVLIVSHTKPLSIDIEQTFRKKIVYSYFINDIDEIYFLR